MDQKSKKIDKAFVSNIDIRLAEFRAKHSPTKAQQAEINKYKKIYELRDNPNAKHPHTDDDIWH